jgi:hypothetical protein
MPIGRFKDPKNSTRILLGMINTFRKVANTKVNIKKSSFSMHQQV